MKNRKAQNMAIKKAKSPANYLKLEEILAKRNLLTKESIFKDVVENETVRQIGKVILAATFISGLVVLSAVAPNIFGALGKLSKNLRRQRKSLSKKEELKIRKTIYNLQNRKLIEWNQSGEKIMLKITPKGRSVFLKGYIYELKIKKPNKWDKIWRVVIFDIPNNLGKRRDIFRDRLKKMGFFQFQKSAFINPFPCRAELEAILDYYRLFDYVTYLEATKVSGEEKCRQYFNL